MEEKNPVVSQSWNPDEDHWMIGFKEEDFHDYAT